METELARAPDHVIRERLRHLRDVTIPEKIRDHGQFIQAVMGGEDSPPFLYTIGMHGHGRRELLLVGACSEGIGLLLNQLCADLRLKNRDYTHGEVVPTGGLSLVALDADDTVVQQWTRQAGNHYRHDAYQVTQLVLCDPQGLFPWDPGCAEPYRNYPLFNMRPRPSEVN